MQHDDLLEAEIEQFEHEARRIAAGGWRRAMIGFLLGSAVGLAAALVMPRDEGPRRRPSGLRPEPLPHDGEREAWRAASPR